MSAPGWYRMHRGWLDNEALGGAREPFCRRAAWAWLIEEAQFQDGPKLVGSKTINLRRGELSSSYRYMAKAWNWDEARVRRFIARLIECNMTACVIDAGQCRITICKYEEYQTSGSVADAPSDAGPTQDRRTGDAKEKEGKKERREEEDKEEGDEPPPAPAADIAPEPPQQPKPIQLELVSATVHRIRDEPREAVDLWNAAVPAMRGSKVDNLTDERRSSLRQRLGECGGIEGWKIALQRIRESDFLAGRVAPRPGRKRFKVYIDFVLRPNEFAKIMEGAWGHDDEVDADVPVEQLTGAAMWAAIAARTKGGHA